MPTKLTPIAFYALLFSPVPLLGGIVEIHLNKALRTLERDVTSFINSFSGSSEILTSVDRSKTFIDRYEYISKKDNLVIAYELTRDPKVMEGKERVTALYSSNEGRRITKDDKGNWIWLPGVRVLRIDTETWKAKTR